MTTNNIERVEKNGNAMSYIPNAKRYDGASNHHEAGLIMFRAL
jgi:hypothetical protein